MKRKNAKKERIIEARENKKDEESIGREMWKRKWKKG